MSVNLTAVAQTAVNSAKKPVVILSGHSRTISPARQSVILSVSANTDYSISSSADWVTLLKDGNKVKLYVESNPSLSARSATITIMSVEDSAAVRTFTLSQSADRSVEALQDIEVRPTSATDNNHNGSSTAALTVDGNLSTIYHSQWGGGNVTADNPAILTYSFQNAHIDYITYVPRQDGGNGCFGVFDLYYRKAGQSEYTLISEYDFGESGAASTIYLGQSGMDSIAGIRFVVKSGKNVENSRASYASCAEMQFRVLNTGSVASSVFDDALMTRLKPGVTRTQIDTLDNAFVRDLALQLMAGTYDEQYRVDTFQCLKDVTLLSEEWNAPGKRYDVTQGVTGIMIAPGKIAVAAEGIPSGVGVSLEVYGWTVPDNQYYKHASYPLHNGLNLIDHNQTWNGLAYIYYYSRTPDQYGPVKVHFINGIQNGVLTPDKTNDQMEEIVARAPYTTIDLVGEKVHSVWETQALLRYTTGRYRKYINTLDSLIAWEHDLLGFTKYGRVPKNKTLAYVNYNYYMYQGGLGVSFKYDTQNRCCDPENIISRDDDVVWGLSHEWGHQHQMHPYFCWGGMGEVTNNMNSCYNVLKMGYPGNRITNEYNSARRQIYSSDSKAGTYSSQRHLAYRDRNNFAFSPKLQALFTAMEDSTITSRAKDSTRALSHIELGTAGIAPLFMLQGYFMQHGLPDFMPDVYEALRLTDTDSDKYALIASAQNAHTDRLALLRQMDSTSCWVKENYVNESSTRTVNSVPFILNYIRKASRVSGYNLFPYFDRWGFIRQIALKIGDYGSYYYGMTEDMYTEFRQDMEQLVADGVLQEMPAGMVDAISTASVPHFPRPEIPN